MDSLSAPLSLLGAVVIGLILLSSGLDDSEPINTDAADAESLYRLLESDIVPAFYDRDGRDVPRRHTGRQDQPPKAGVRVYGLHDHDRRADRFGLSCESGR